MRTIIYVWHRTGKFDLNSIINNKVMIDKACLSRESSVNVKYQYHIQLEIRNTRWTCTTSYAQMKPPPAQIFLNKKSTEPLSPDAIANNNLVSPGYKGLIPLKKATSSCLNINVAWYYEYHGKLFLLSFLGLLDCCKGCSVKSTF